MLHGSRVERRSKERRSAQIDLEVTESRAVSVAELAISNTSGETLDSGELHAPGVEEAYLEEGTTVLPHQDVRDRRKEDLRLAECVRGGKVLQKLLDNLLFHYPVTILG